MRKPTFDRAVAAIFVALFVYFMTGYFNSRPPIIQNGIAQWIIGIVLAGCAGYFMINIADKNKKDSSE